MRRIEEMSLWERLYFPEVIRGLTVTGYRFWRNLAIHTLQKLGMARNASAAITVQCPAECIYIEAGEDPKNPVEKYPVRYEIDTLRCIYCGFCVEACPCDAVRMDSGTHPGNLGFGRKEFVETKEVLMQRSKKLDEKGKEGLYEEYVKPYRHV